MTNWKDLTDDELDDLIDQWHEKPENKTLYEFLGMTKQEYEKWLTQGMNLSNNTVKKENNND